jgi:uncharacterized membrane protein
MAGSVAGTTITHRSRGVVCLKAVITCDASGVATATKVGTAFGRLVGISYAPGTLATGVDITISDSDSGAAIVTLTDVGTSARFLRPSTNVTDNTGTAVAAATTAVDVNRDIYVAGVLKVAAAQGGNLGSGTLRLFVEE